MKIALINNGTAEPEKLLALLSGHDVRVFNSTKAGDVDTSQFEVLILSGSSKFPIMGNEGKLEPEFSLVLNSTIPVIGICYGCELIARAFCGTLVDLGEGNKERDVIDVDVVVDHPMFQGKKSFKAYDAHRWAIESLRPELEILAHSKHGPEVIRHRIRPITGFQFHPEKMVDESFGDEIFNSVLSSY